MLRFIRSLLLSFNRLDLGQGATPENGVPPTIQQ